MPKRSSLFLSMLFIELLKRIYLSYMAIHRKSPMSC